MCVPAEERLAWLRTILANNLADHARRLTAEKRDMGREVPLQRAIELSSQRLEDWFAIEMPPDLGMEQEEQLLSFVAACPSLPEAQREAITLHYWSGWTLMQIAEQLGRSRDATAGLIKRGLRQLRINMGAKGGNGYGSGEEMTDDMADGSQSCLADAAVAEYLEAVGRARRPTLRNS